MSEQLCACGHEKHEGPCSACDCQVEIWRQDGPIVRRYLNGRPCGCFRENGYRIYCESCRYD